MKNLLLLTSTFFISISLIAQIEMPQPHEIKFPPRSPFLDSLNNKLFIQPLDTSFSFSNTFFKQRNKINKKYSTKIKTVSNSTINEYLLKSNKIFKKHSFGIGSTLLLSEIFSDADIAYLSLVYRYLFNKKSNVKFLFLHECYYDYFLNTFSIHLLGDYDADLTPHIKNINLPVNLLWLEDEFHIPLSIGKELYNLLETPEKEFHIFDSICTLFDNSQTRLGSQSNTIRDFEDAAEISIYSEKIIDFVEKYK